MSKWKHYSLTYWPLQLCLFTNIGISKQMKFEEANRETFGYLFTQACVLSTLKAAIHYYSEIVSTALRKYQLFFHSISSAIPYLQEVSHYLSNSAQTRHSSGRLVS